MTPRLPEGMPPRQHRVLHGVCPDCGQPCIWRGPADSGLPMRHGCLCGVVAAPWPDERQSA